MRPPDHERRGPRTEIQRPAGRSTPPRLCIGLPVYNGERFLDESIRSILDQTFSDFELIVSDNASTDSTPDIIAKHAAADRRVRYVRHDTNIGASANFDSVWRRCTSPYFKWMAADDTCSPTFLQSCIEVLDADPDVGLVYPKSAFIGPDSFTLYAFDQLVTTPDTWSTSRYSRSRQVVDVLLTDGSAANVMIFGVIRSDILHDVRPIGNYFGADLPLVAELVIRAGVVELPQTMSFLRRHVGSSSTYARSPSARSQQDFYDPSVRGSMRLQWNLRRRYATLLRVVAGANVNAPRRIGLIGSLFGAVARRLVWRVRFERDLRAGVTPQPLEWPGGPVHWSAVNEAATGA